MIIILSLSLSLSLSSKQTAALRLQKELTKYMNALRVLGQCTKSLAEVLDDLYEPGWKGHDKYARYSEVSSW